MAPFRPEQATLPVRFLCLTAHLAAWLTILFGIESYVSDITEVNPATTTSQSDLDYYDETKQQVSGILYGGIACFGIEYITLFVGVSIFFAMPMFINVALHFSGLILTILLYENSWSFDTLVGFFAAFVALPALLELLTFVFVTRFSFLKY